MNVSVSTSSTAALAQCETLGELVAAVEGAATVERCEPRSPASVIDIRDRVDASARLRTRKVETR